MTPGAILLDALKKIARGRPDSGRPLAAENARQLARLTLTLLNLDWKEKPHGNQGTRSDHDAAKDRGPPA
jgi:hypothetical protein